MEFQIKNDRVARILKESEAFDAEQLKDLPQTDERVCEAVITPYAYDVIYQAAAHDVTLDFSYETLSGLPVGLSGVYKNCRRQNRSIQNSGNLTIRSYAAYLFLLAINEHDCHLRGEIPPSPLLTVSQEEEARWMMGTMRILTGIRREVVFLPAVHEAAAFVPLGRKTLLTFEADPICRAYLSACRVDLGKRGLSNIAIEVE